MVAGALTMSSRAPRSGIAFTITRHADNLPSMAQRAEHPPEQPRHWRLQDAKSRFGELVRRVRSDGPQHVTVQGREAVVVISAEEFRRLTGPATGQSLIDALQASPHRDIDLEPESVVMPVRDVGL